MSRIIAVSLALFALAIGGPAGAEEKKAVKPDAAAVAKAKKALEKAADASAPGAAPAREAALAEVRAAPKIVRFEALCRALDSSSRKPVRALAAAELAVMGERAAAPILVQALVREADRPTRAEVTKALRALAAPDTGAFLASHLAESDPRRRIRAMQGLSVFRDRRAVPGLVKHVEMIAGGFGKAAIEITADRAYIADWELVSGGTGLVVVEVADPEIEIARSGVSMDVQVQRVEMRFTVALLNDLTGAAIGADAAAWRSWLAANPDFKLADRK